MDEEYCVIDKDVETKMKRLALAGSIIAFTFILGILAVAVAQRDARQRSEETTLRPDYSQQQPDPLLAHLSPTRSN